LIYLKKEIVNYNSFWDELNTDDCEKDKYGKVKEKIDSVPKIKTKKGKEFLIKKFLFN